MALQTYRGAGPCRARAKRHSGIGEKEHAACRQDAPSVDSNTGDRARGGAYEATKGAQADRIVTIRHSSSGGIRRNIAGRTDSLPSREIAHAPRGTRELILSKVFRRTVSFGPARPSGSGARSQIRDEPSPLHGFPAAIQDARECAARSRRHPPEFWRRRDSIAPRPSRRKQWERLRMYLVKTWEPRQNYRSRPLRHRR